MSPRRAVLRWGPACLAAALLAGASGHGAGDRPAGPASEYQIKAAYLYYFSTYVRWPEGVAAGGGDLVIGILGDDPFGRLLDDTLRDKSAGERRLTVRRFADARAAIRSHILFVSPSEETRLPRILETLAGTPVLTVSDIDRFAERGGQVGFRMEDRKVRFDINLASTESAGLRISAQLLKLARIVRPGASPGGPPE